MNFKIGDRVFVTPTDKKRTCCDFDCRGKIATVRIVIGTELQLLFDQKSFACWFYDSKVTPITNGWVE